MSIVDTDTDRTNYRASLQHNFKIGELLTTYAMSSIPLTILLAIIDPVCVPDASTAEAYIATATSSCFLGALTATLLSRRHYKRKYETLVANGDMSPKYAYKHCSGKSFLLVSAFALATAYLTTHYAFYNYLSDKCSIRNIYNRITNLQGARTSFTIETRTDGKVIANKNASFIPH